MYGLTLFATPFASPKIKLPPSTHLQKSVFGGSLVKFLAFVGILTLVGTASSQTELVTNEKFQTNAALFSTFPGYLGDGTNPTAIPNWLTLPDNSGKGINGEETTGAGTAFGPTDTGSNTYAFIQGGGNEIYQYLALAPHTTYTLNIDIAGRAGDVAPEFSVKFSNGGEVPFWDSNSLNGGSPVPASQSAFTHYSVPFTTPAAISGANIQLWNESPTGDNTVCFANISILGSPVEDTTPPTITPPPDVTVLVNSGTSYATNVALFTPIAADNSGSVTVTSNAPSQFPIGVTTVTWTAVDPSDNQATAAQNVTVVPPPNLSFDILPTSHHPQLTLTGGAGRAARLEGSTNLMSWTTLATIPQTNAPVQWEDSTATNLLSRFYRSLQLTALDTYAVAPDPNYSYTLVSTAPDAGQTTYVLEMTSQTWLTTNQVDRPLWKHWMIIVKPDVVAHSTALLHISAGNNGGAAPTAADSIIRQIALNTQSVVAELRMVPNQPLTFFGETQSRVEDGIMAYAWDKFLDFGDEQWIPRLPMTKAAVLAMDTVTAFCAGAPGGGINVDKFVVTGASKRGWTTWATAIVDSRVEAIIPVVIDMLNLRTSFIHHYRSYGFWAPAIADYEAMGIMDRMDTPEFAALMAIEDPYEYRARLALPKFLINASSDEFFLPDSSQYYFDDLPGVKYLRYVPNAGHGVAGSPDAWATVEACYHAVITSATLPEFSWTLPTSNSIRVVTIANPSNVKLWQASNPSARDFRLNIVGSSAWTSTTLTDQGGGVYVGTVATPSSGYRAFFVELTYPGSGAQSFKFTTRVKVVPDTEPFPYPPN